MTSPQPQESSAAPTFNFSDITASLASTLGRNIRPTLSSMLRTSQYNITQTCTFSNNSSKYIGFIVKDQEGASLDNNWGANRFSIDSFSEHLSRYMAIRQNCSIVSINRNEIEVAVYVGSSTFKVIILFVKKEDSTRNVVLGYSGYGALLLHVFESIGYIYEDGLFRLNVYSGDEVIGSINVFSDAFAIEEFLLINSYSRIGYSLPNPQSVMSHLLTSKLFSLESAKLDENLVSTVENPDPILRDFQAKVIEEHNRREAHLKFPAKYNREGFKKATDKVLEAYGVLGRINRVVNEHSRSKIIIDRLSEASEIAGIAPEKLPSLTEKLKKEFGLRFEFTVMSSSPIALARRLNPSGNFSLIS